MRVGNSTDFHKLVENRELILGGVKIPYEKGLLGDSDADCLLHAISEAIFGALAKGDLGTYFKSSDSQGLNSEVILLKAKSFLIEEGYTISNIDSMILLEEPKLNKYIIKMRENIARILEIDVNKISVKATTMEGCGIVGKKEGCLCNAVVLLEEIK